MTSRLAQLAVQNWEDYNGYAVAHGMPDLRAMPVSHFLDFVWYLTTRNGDQKEVEKFRRSVWMPPKGVKPDARSPWSAENETKAFDMVARMVGQ